MGKYSKYDKREVVAPYKIHPVWRGFGCIMMILVPIMSGAAAAEMVNGMGKQLEFMSGMNTGYVRLPDVFYSLPYISRAANYISSINNLALLSLFFLVFLLFFSGIIAVLYSVIYRVIGPPRYTQIDAPAPRMSSTKKYKR